MARDVPRERRSLPGRVAVVGAAFAAVLAATGLAACGSDGGPDPGAAAASPVTSSSGSGSSASPTPFSPADLAGQRAVEAYLGMWQATAEASHTSDWQAPELSRYASGAALQTITGNLYADHLNGVVARGEPVNTPRVTSVDPPDTPTTVLISDCGDDSGWLKYRTDGSLFNETPGGRRSITSEVKLHSDGQWRVTRFAVEGTGTC